MTTQEKHAILNLLKAIEDNTTAFHDENEFCPCVSIEYIKKEINKIKSLINL